MRIKIQRGREVQIIDDCTMFIAEDRDGNPLSVACQVDPSVCVVSSIDAGAAEFNRVLKGLGIDKTVFPVDLREALKPPESLPHLIGQG